MKSKVIKCIIFDFDDTLYTGNVWGNWVEFLTKCYLEALPHKKASDIPYKVYLSSIAFVEHIVNNEGLSSEVFVRYQEENIYQFSTKNVEVIDCEILRRLKPNYILTIVSNSSVPYIKYHSQELGIDLSLFDEIQQNNYLPEDMSKAVNYKDIMKKFHLKPEEILVIGDSYANDIVPAKKMGLSGLQINNVKEVERYLNMMINNDFSFLNY